jgi:hypothetical protein
MSDPDREYEIVLFCRHDAHVIRDDDHGETQ